MERVVIVTLSDDVGEGHHTLRAGDSITIGRDRSADLVSAETTISRHHAIASFDGTACTVADSGSKRGVFINGQRIERYEAEGTTELRLADPETGPLLRLTWDLERASSSPWETITKRLTVRSAGIAAGLMVGLLLVLRLVGGDGDARVHERLVTALASTDAGVIGGGGVVVDGERGLVLTAAVDLGTTGTYTVVIDTDSGQVSFAAVEVARSTDAVLLQLIGLDTVPVIADRLAALGAGEVADTLPGSFDLIQPPSVLGGAEALELGLDKQSHGDRVSVAVDEAEGLRPWEILVHGNDVVGLAVATCPGSDESLALQVAPLGDITGDLTRLAESPAGQLAGPAPYGSSIDHHGFVVDPYVCRS